MNVVIRHYVSQKLLGEWDLPWVPRPGEVVKLVSALGPDEYIVNSVTYELNAAGYRAFVDVRDC